MCHIYDIAQHAFTVALLTHAMPVCKHVLTPRLNKTTPSNEFISSNSTTIHLRRLKLNAHGAGCPLNMTKAGTFSPYVTIARSSNYHHRK